MPAVSERQRRFMGAELSRKRRGKKTRTGMSEAQLEDFASKELDDSFIGDEVMEKQAIKSITKYLGKTDKDFKTALDAFSTKPKTSAEAAAHGYPKGLAPEERGKYDEAAAKITPPKRVISKEDGYPPTRGERRDKKRAAAKKMKVTGHGTKNLERIIGVKAAKARGEDVSKGMAKSKGTPYKAAISLITVYMKEEEYPKSKAIDLTGAPKPPKEMMDRARKALAGARTARRAAKNGKPASGDEVAMKAIEKIAAYNKG